MIPIHRHARSQLAVIGEQAWSDHETEAGRALRSRHQKAASTRSTRAAACGKATKPNAAHYGLATLQDDFDVHVVTTNIDDLHERAGNQLHPLHPSQARADEANTTESNMRLYR